MKQQEKKESWTTGKGKLLAFIGLLLLGFALTVLGIYKSIQSCCPTRTSFTSEEEGGISAKSTQKTLSNQGTAPKEKGKKLPTSTQVKRMPTGYKENGNFEIFPENHQSSFYTCSDGTQVKVLRGSKFESVMDTEVGGEEKSEEMQPQQQQREEKEDSSVEEQESNSSVEEGQDHAPSRIKEGEFPKRSMKSLNLSKISANPGFSNKSFSFKSQESELINQSQEQEQEEEQD